MWSTQFYRWNSFFLFFVNEFRKCRIIIRLQHYTVFSFMKYLLVFIFFTYLYIFLMFLETFSSNQKKKVSRNVTYHIIIYCPYTKNHVIIIESILLYRSPHIVEGEHFYIHIRIQMPKAAFFSFRFVRYQIILQLFLCKYIVIFREMQKDREREW